MSISIQDLVAFVAIHETGSFSTAADKLCVTSPALSRRIKKLEDFVGDDVFDRSSHRIHLTATGLALLGRAERLLREFADFEQFAATVARENEVEVHFSSIMSVAGAVIPTAIKTYSEKYPRAQFVIHDCNGIDAQRMVEEERVEFAVTTRPPPESMLDFVALCGDLVVLACPPEHQLFDAPTVNWRNLTNCKVMLMEGASSTSELITRSLHEIGVPVPSGVRVQQLSTQIGFVEKGECAAVLPALSASLITNPEVRIIPITGPIVRRDIGILTKTGRPISRSSLSFLDWIRGQFPAIYAPLIEVMNWSSRVSDVKQD